MIKLLTKKEAVLLWKKLKILEAMERHRPTTKSGLYKYSQLNYMTGGLALAQLIEAKCMTATPSRRGVYVLTYTDKGRQLLKTWRSFQRTYEEEYLE